MARRPRWSFEDKYYCFNKHQGRCALCGGAIHMESYAKRTAQGWHIDHSKPLAQGGHLTNRNNLQAAHVDCNLWKGARSSRSARGEHGRTRAPHTWVQEHGKRDRATKLGLLGGAAAGAMVAGPAGAFVGAVLGGAAGSRLTVDEDCDGPMDFCEATTRAGDPCLHMVRRPRRWCHVHAR